MSNLVHLSTASERRLTTAQLAEHLQLSERWVRYRLAEGMPCLRYGRTLRFIASEVDAWLNERYADAA